MNNDKTKESNDTELVVYHKNPIIRFFQKIGLKIKEFIDNEFETEQVSEPKIYRTTIEEAEQIANMNIEDYDKQAKGQIHDFKTVHENFIEEMENKENYNYEAPQSQKQSEDRVDLKSKNQDTDKDEDMKKDSLNNGHILEVTPDMFERAANDFSEGNEDLKELLTFCFENDIKTTACCSDYNGKKTPYIQFEFDDKNMKSILKILKLVSLDDGINNFTFKKQPGVLSNFSVSMKNDRYDEGFKQILQALKYEKEIEISDLDESRELIVKSMQNHSVPNSYMEIQEENDSIGIAVGIEYLEIIPPEYDTKLWMEETEMAEYSKDSKELNRTLRRLEAETKNRKSILESNAKNQKYLKDHPYDREKIDELWNNRNNNFKTINIDPQSTMERQHKYGELNVALFDVLDNSSIESFAKEIMQLNQYGQACITRFDSFVIDSRDYENSGEIVQAYWQALEREKKNTNITIGEVRDATEDVKISDINNETGEIKQEVKEEQQLRKGLDSQNVEAEL